MPLEEYRGGRGAEREDRYRILGIEADEKENRAGSAEGIEYGPYRR